jgi:hypothetical protein
MCSPLALGRNTDRKDVEKKEKNLNWKFFREL